ncbi:MAG: hypothetical protein COV55_01120 [Candidatus Komeilibacteria bacterium CG11_big_fil_rev_8_21_14_0_20_36_20]|uniref:Uncharacterized protein n=1 Tax=Candidatus Komeilibacteria bacterium CG11_big_fil_rev_8_21_14_0_20_36_20 TaxID=1974477 RepID=A0A2H0NDN2_9BACT|nr:MAG: hypothetical protein COV55_01120 [Candidatus Komeilibacteria bacterium CG11_big_fil_rev_8_21_14_0_20_36_20]PIR81381.1 MAG: hypothetical protein COU21_04090 [Candidatus Komeilibacteria bacterium CG10_big_fil_rev_8_21_14_0_10_36_65]PJC55106.1 MAG: hypothetical protein CO027_03045 [Candidatus Komeilibacteria bacterium CG_4_9_14_0_2_um_filter_36_13]
MTEERWREIKHQIKESFSIENEYSEELSPGAVEVVEFVGPQGKTQMRFVTKPKVLDKKTTYSNRAGSDVKVDYIYSEDENVSYLEIFIWSEDKDDWQKVDADSLF